MNVIVPDGHLLPEDIEFPPLAAVKFSWLQFLGLNREEMEDRCWRMHCVVTLNTPLDAALLNTMGNLELLIVANHDLSLVDLQAAEKNNVTVCQVPDLNPSQFDIKNRDQAQQLCNTIVNLIDHYEQQK